MQVVHLVNVRRTRLNRQADGKARNSSTDRGKVRCSTLTVCFIITFLGMAPIMAWFERVSNVSVVFDLSLLISLFLGALKAV